MPCTSPLGFVKLDELPGRLLERHVLIRTLERTFASLNLDWILSIGNKLAGMPRSLPRFLEAEGMQRAKPHVTSPPIQHVSEQPGLGAATRYLQPKPMAIAVAPRLLQSRHRQCV